ncbi:polysaccharide ABC transporter ATP-binding protein [Cyanobium sp. Morenito 9A2]|uniref:ABC transporter ATP-binding protein n=1 Tax=Cyanobium sp. Morenito 9A2 TaxID=2823718 RepID=UPI0020CD249F|nr:polysaccharide ABC transporter ATP-binding protein [Cyanobium sp. Morenito 9A2]MCP9850238.1 ATP-binding cassette domain-containing protein [Cyanobium sp. Morenito 9A2]
MNNQSGSSCDVAVRVNSLGKCYRIDHLEQLDESQPSSPAAGRPAGLIRRRLGRAKERLSHESFWALRDVSFEVPSGQVLGIIGRNGAGKSTFLKILSRIIEPTTGVAEIRGRVGSLLEVGTGFHPELTGRENIYLNGTLLGMRKRQIDVILDDIIAFAEVEQFIDTPVKRYSSGMYVRLAFAVAAHLEPDILIIDEVLSVGDALFQQRCLGRMQRLGDKGRTVIFVSHSMDSIVALCERAIVLDRGRIAFDGKPADAANAYYELCSSRKSATLDFLERGGSHPMAVQQVECRFLPASHPTPEMNPVNAGSVKVEIHGELPPILRHKSAQLTLAIGINQENGQRIGTYIANDMDEAIRIRGANFSYGFLLERLPLIPGRYFLDVSLINRGETIDSLQRCASFRIPVQAGLSFQDVDPRWGAVSFSCVGYNIQPSQLLEYDGKH